MESPTSPHGVSAHAKVLSVFVNALFVQVKVESPIKTLAESRHDAEQVVADVWKTEANGAHVMLTAAASKLKSWSTSPHGVSILVTHEMAFESDPCA
jgi:hypothetical protein